MATGVVSRTAGELLSDAHALARAMPDDIAGREVVLVADDRYVFAAALVACTIRGAIAALPPSAQPEMVREIRHRENVVTVLHDRSGMLGIDLRAILEKTVPVPFAPLAPLAPSQPIVDVYTSGTTGTPMRCPKTAGQLIGEADTLRGMFAIGPGTPIIATVPPHHVYGLLFGVLLPLVSGASFTRETVLHGEPLAGLVRRDGARVLVSVPAHLRALRSLDPGALPVLGDVSFALDPAVVEQLLHAPPKRVRFFNGYAGWAPGQLALELEHGGWYVLNADADTVFRRNMDTLWEELLLRVNAITASLRLPVEATLSDTATRLP